MGGSSLGPGSDARRPSAQIGGFPELHVLDSTDPAQVKAFEKQARSEGHALHRLEQVGLDARAERLQAVFLRPCRTAVGAKEAGRRFVAITDPGSKMQQVAEGDGFRRVFFGWPNIGGRYSALSDFGLVPAAIMGVDVAKFLDRTEEMVCACMPSVPVAENPGVVLGTILGVAAKQFGRDK